MLHVYLIKAKDVSRIGRTVLSCSYPCTSITISNTHWHTHSYIVQSPL